MIKYTENISYLIDRLCRCIVKMVIKQEMKKEWTCWLENIYSQSRLIEPENDKLVNTTYASLKITELRICHDI